MKKLLTGIFAMLTCFSCLAATGCDIPFFGGNKDSESGTQVEFDLEGAADNLYSMYVADHAETSEDYYVVNTVLYDELYYNVAWSVDVMEGVTLEAGTGDYEGMTKVNVDELTTVDIEYVLTASITYEDSEAETVNFNRTVVSIVDPNALSRPIEGTAYYMYLEQVTADKTLYVTGKMDKQNKYLDMTANPEEAKEVYVDAVTGGYKFYVLNDETKSYIKLTQSGPNDKGNYSASVSWATDGSIFYYNPLGCWACDLENDTFFIGTYSNYETISASSDFYMTDKNGNSNIGTSQFPALLMLPEDVPEITAAEKLEKEEENLTIQLEIYEAGEVTLPTAGKDYSDVVISWVSSNPAIAAVDGGKVTYTLPETETDVTLTATLTLGNETPVEKAFTVTVKKVGSAIPVADTPYYMGSTMANGKLYFNGTISSGRINGTTTLSDAVPVYFEATANAKEYYLYFIDGETKTYIYVANDKAAGLAFSTTAPTDVWIVDPAVKKIVSKTTDRGIGTQLTSTYTNLSSYDISNTSGYDFAWLEPVVVVNKYNLTLKVDDVTGNPIEVAEGATLDATIFGTNPTKEGYTFAKWVKEDGTDAPATMPAADLTLKATWTVNPYTLTIKVVDEADIVITFGAEKTDTITHLPTELAAALAEKLPDGYEWNKEVPETFAFENYVFEAILKTIPKHSLTFKVDNDTFKTVNAVAVGATLSDYLPTAAENPTKEGYTFVKWTQGDGTDAPATMPTSDLTLVAKWELNVYTVTVIGSDETITFAIVADTDKNAIALADVAAKAAEILETEQASEAAGITLSYKEVPDFALENATLEIVKTATTISAALAAADGTLAEITGVVSVVSYTWSSSGNMTVNIADSEGNTIKLYKLATKVYLGDTITVKGEINDYNGNQIAEGATATIVSHDDSYDVTTIADALKSEKVGAKATVTGTVVEVVTTGSSIGSYIAADDGTRLFLFKLTNVTLGQIITVTGEVGAYNNVNQIAQGATFEAVGTHTCSNYTEATCKAPATCVVCGTTTGEKTNDHDYDEGVCTVCGGVDPDYEGGVVAPTTITASKTIAELIESEGWTNSTTKQTFTLDDNVTVKVNGGSNTGKAYNGDHIRIYATDSPAGTLTITVPEEYELVSVKVSAVTGTYAFLYVDETNTDICNVATAVSGSSVVLKSVKNGDEGKQVRVTAIEVVYKAK